MDRGYTISHGKAALRPLAHRQTLRIDAKRSVSVRSAVKTQPPETKTSVEDLPLPEGSYGLPLVGETVAFLSDPTYVEERFEQYGRVFKTDLFFSKTVFIGDANIIEKIEKASPRLVENTSLPSGMKILGEDSLINLNGPRHAFQRRLLMKAFSSRAVESYMNAIDVASQEALQEWATKDSFLFVPEVKKYIFGAVADRVIGLPLEKGKLVEVLQTFNAWWGGLLSFGINLPFTKFTKAMQAREQLIEIIDQGMEIARANGTDDRRALPLLLNVRDDDGSALSDQEIKDSVLLLMAAGYDTTAAVIIRTLRNLTKYPQVLEKAIKEQEEVVSKLGGDITKTSLEAMPYLEAVLKETMRIDPPAPIGIRKAVKTFEIDGVKVPEGWQVMFGYLPGMILDESQWENGQAFDPERMLTGNSPDLGRSFLSFGTGVHACIGKFLAIMQLKIFFARLLRSYEFEVETPDGKMNIQAVPEPIDKMPIKIWTKV